MRAPDNRRADWPTIKTHPFYADLVRDLEQKGQQLLQTPEPCLSFHDFMRFNQTGNRIIFETAYFERRAKLAVYAMMCLLGEEERYLAPLENIIWAVCDEYSWCLPAHLPLDLDIEKQQVHLDLFASETGFTLSEILHLLGDRLSPMIRRRIAASVKNRCVDAFLNTPDYFWETTRGNWAVVCAGSIGMAFMYQATRDEFDRALPRLLRATEYFLSSYHDDGACMEGYKYWWYGFGYFLLFAEQLARFTEGKINLLSSEKVAEIAKYQQRVVLMGYHTVSFSDDQYASSGPGDRSRFCFDLGITHFLHRTFKGIALPDQRYAMRLKDDHCFRWGLLVRRFLWSDPALPDNTLKLTNHYFRDAQWYVKHTPHYSLVAKGGHNDEPHNHNDVGNFILYARQGCVFWDTGAGEYTGDYFDGKHRYEHFVTSSRGHNLPIINGQYQLPWREHGADHVVSGDDSFGFSFERAYALAELTGLHRQFRFTDDTVILTDTFAFNRDHNRVTERFICTEEPRVGPGVVTVGSAQVHFRPDLECQVSSETYANHEAAPERVFLLDLTFHCDRAAIFELVIKLGA